VGFRAQRIGTLLELIQRHDRLRAELPVNIVPVRHVTREKIVADEIGRNPLIPRWGNRHEFRVCFESRFDQRKATGAVIGKWDARRCVADLLSVENHASARRIGTDNDASIDTTAAQASRCEQAKGDDPSDRNPSAAAKTLWSEASEARFEIDGPIHHGRFVRMRRCQRRG